MLAVNFDFRILTTVKIYVKSSQNLYFKATKQEIHNETTEFKFMCKYFEFCFDLKVACRLENYSTINRTSYKVTSHCFDISNK